MNIDQLRIYIPDYLLDKADPDICQQIEAAAELDPGFREELEQEHATLTAARIYREGGLKDKLEAIQKNQIRPFYLRPAFRWTVAAAVIFLLLIVSGVQIGNRMIQARDFLTNSYPDHISEEYQQQLDSPGMTAPAQLQDLINGLKAYSSGNYSKSEPILTSFLLSYPGAEEVRFYVGLIYWKTGQQEAAIQEWQKVADSNLPLFRDEARLRLIAWHITNWEFFQANKWKGIMQEEALPESLQKLDQIW